MTTTKSFSRLAFNRLALGLTITVIALAPIFHAQAFLIWQGPGTDPSDVANYNAGPAPAFGAVNAESILTNIGSNDFTYNSPLTTTYGTSAGSLNGLFWQGANFGAGSGGTANTSNVIVTAGTVNLSGAFVNGDDNGAIESIWIGNGGAVANFTVNGGNVNALNGTIVGRDGSSGTLSVSNGSFTTGILDASTGTIIGGAGAATGTVTIGNGGQFSLTGAAAEPIQFGSLTASAINVSNNFLAFTDGSTGVVTLNLSLATLGTSYFDSLIANGFVKIGDSVVTDASQFTIDTSSASAATLSLASVPEPSTVELTVIGAAVGMLLVFRRRHTS